jgi:hypothetical protein
MTAPTFGSIVYSFFLDYLPQQKGLRPSSIRSYRDTLRLFLTFASAQTKRGVSKLRFDDLGLECCLAFFGNLSRRAAMAYRPATSASRRYTRSMSMLGGECPRGFMCAGKSPPFP